MEGKRLRTHLPLRKGGVTLIELLVALVIGAMVVAGIYRVFVAQTRAYTIQDQVVEVQQSIRSAMEVILRDLRMAGYGGDSTPLINPSPIIPGGNSITVSYLYNGAIRTVVYTVDGSSKLKRNQIPPDNPPLEPDGDPILENVDALTFTYGVDGRVGLAETQDGAIDDMNGDGEINAADFVSAATVNAGNLNVIAVRVSLTARPEKLNAQDDRFKMMQPRTLVSAITIRNLCLLKTN